MRWFSGFRFRSTHERCLEAEIPLFELHLDHAIQTRTPGEWGQSAKAAVAAASVALRQRHIAEALIAFNRAQREEIPSLTEEEIHLRAISLIHQSDQINEVARDTIKEILQNKTHSTTAMELSTATQLRDEDIQRTFFSTGRLSRHLTRLTIITLVVLLGVVALAAGHVVIDSTSILLGVICFGALGAALSMMISISPFTVGPIQNQLATGVLLFARPVFGASAGVAVYVLIKMGVLNLPYHSDFAYFGLAFAAGFSDQLLLSAVSKVATPSSGSAKGEDHRQ
jgi:hypothetical protein